MPAKKKTRVPLKPVPEKVVAPLLAVEEPKGWSVNKTVKGAEDRWRIKFPKITSRVFGYSEFGITWTQTSKLILRIENGTSSDVDTEPYPFFMDQFSIKAFKQLQESKIKEFIEEKKHIITDFQAEFGECTYDEKTSMIIPFMDESPEQIVYTMFPDGKNMTGTSCDWKAGTFLQGNQLNALIDASGNSCFILNYYMNTFDLIAKGPTFIIRIYPNVEMIQWIKNGQDTSIRKTEIRKAARVKALIGEGQEILKKAKEFDEYRASSSSSLIGKKRKETSSPTSDVVISSSSSSKKEKTEGGVQE